MIQQISPHDLEAMKRRYAEVRSREESLRRAAGVRELPRYQYQTGPDGKKYAVSGEVDMDMTTVPGDPEATLRRARRIYRAAFVSADVSPSERRAAMDARRVESKAAAELAMADSSGHHLKDVA